jgi:predicted Zn-ribbon and HTH transcriptional regulator
VSVCQSFQPVQVRQNPQLAVTIPSLYGITRSLKNIEYDLKTILNECKHEYEVVKDDNMFKISKCKKCGKSQMICK